MIPSKRQYNVINSIKTITNHKGIFISRYSHMWALYPKSNPNKVKMVIKFPPNNKRYTKKYTII